MCIFSTLIIWELYFKVQTSSEAQNFVPLLSLSLHSSSPTFKLLSMASYGGELLLDSSSPWSGVSSHLLSPFHFHSSSRSKGLDWWRRSKAYMLHMELHHVVSGASSSTWCSFASSICLFGQFTLIPCSSSYSPCISSIVLLFGVV